MSHLPLFFFSPSPHVSFSDFIFFSCFQMNDFVRDKFTTEDDTIPLPAEILAGGCVSISLEIL